MRVLVVILTGAVLWGCPAASVRSDELPAGYVLVDRGTYAWRALSAEGIVVGWTAYEHEPAGTLDFWSAVVGKELAFQRGYVLRSSEDLPGARGVTRVLVFSAPAAESSWYVLAMHVGRSRIYALHAGGPAAAVEKEMPVLKGFAERMVTRFADA